MRKHTFTALLAVALLGALAAVTISPGAAASTTLNDTTFNVTNQTDSVEVTAMNTSGQLNVTVYGIDNGTETEVANGTLTADGENASTFTHPVNATLYGQYRVVVTGSGAESLVVEKVSVSGGGGLLADPAGFLSGMPDTELAGLGFVLLVVSGMAILARVRG